MHRHGACGHPHLQRHIHCERKLPIRRGQPGSFRRRIPRHHDRALGTLESFTLSWSLTGTFSGSSGGGSISYVGDFLIQSIALPQNGGGGSGGGGAPVSFDFPGTGAISTFTQTYNVADAGTTYDQAILDAITGSGDVTLVWDTPLTISGTFTDAAISATSDVAFSYTYSPVPEPSAVLMGVTAFIIAGFRRRR